jgi:hypothetical protein
LELQVLVPEADEEKREVTFPPMTPSMSKQLLNALLINTVL